MASFQATCRLVTSRGQFKICCNCGSPLQAGSRHLATASSTAPAPVENTTSSSPTPEAKHRPGARLPLLPSVAQLILQYSLDDAAIASITPSGPGGRLLKGDVLVHVGAIPPKTPARLSEMFDRLAHLDLAAMRPVPSKPPKPALTAPVPAARPEEPAPTKPVEVQVAVSLVPVDALISKVRDSLGASPGRPTLFTRAVAIANRRLPPLPPSANDLFDQILGLPSRPSPRPTYQPTLSNAAQNHLPLRSAVAKPDIIDQLAYIRRAQPRSLPSCSAGPVAAGPNVLRLVVPFTEQRRAMDFLGCVKTLLEQNPNTLLSLAVDGK